MSNTAVVVPAQNVQGNISTCQILNQQVKTDLAHWYSFTQTDHYESFNTCTGQVVAEYDVPSINVIWGAPLLVGTAATCIIVPVVLFFAAMRWLDS